MRRVECLHIFVDRHVGTSGASVDERDSAVWKVFGSEPGFDQRFINRGCRHTGIRRHETQIFHIEHRTLHLVVGNSGNLAFQSHLAPFGHEYGSGFSVHQTLHVLRQSITERSYESASRYDNSLGHSMQILSGNIFYILSRQYNLLPCRFQRGNHLAKAFFAVF